jgi:PPP family 3-phenylpropionic acid transporter
MNTLSGAKATEPSGLKVAKLSAYWFFVMGALGVFFPYFTLFLKENIGLSGSQVGVVFATVPFVGIFAQPFWGQIADRTGSRTRLLAVLALCSVFGYAGLFFPGTFLWMMAASALLAVFATSLIPMGISVSMAILSGKGVPNFGRVRVWGSVGYLLAVVGTPPLLGYLQDQAGWRPIARGPSEPGLEVIFLFAALLVAGASVVAWRLPKKGSVSIKADRNDYRILLRHGPFLRVLAFVFGVFFFIHGPMVIFPIFIRSLGGSMASVSYMWIWMILLEIPLVASTHKIYKWIGPRWMVGLAALAAAIRWTVCGFTSSLSVVYPVQLLHGLVIAGLLVAAPLYVEGLVPARLRSTGQGLLTMVGPITAGILSTSLCGFLLDHFGPNAPYIFGGMGALLMCCIAPLLLPRIEKKATR